MCMTAEVRENKGTGAYVGTAEKIIFLCNFIQHLLMGHDDAFTVIVSS